MGYIGEGPRDNEIENTDVGELGPLNKLDTLDGFTSSYSNQTSDSYLWLHIESPRDAQIIP